jgi:aminocarboxymuconate-semialdehyde decarboxylase
MVIDLHSHYIPLEAANSAEAGIRFDDPGSGEIAFRSPHQSMTLERQLFDLDIQTTDAVSQRLDRRILAVPPFCFQYELPAEAGIRWARALNDGYAAAAQTDPERFVPFATLPMQAPYEAIKELERAVGELGCRGVEIGSNINGVELDASELEPFWECVAAAGVPLLIHPHYIAGADRLNGYYLRNLIGNPTDTAIAGARLILSGILERHPELKIILSHGGGALPGILGRILHGYQVRPEARERTSDPAAAAKRLYCDTIVFEPRMLRYLVESFGAEQIILGTDYPFDMGMEQPVDFIETSDLSDRDVATILSNGDRLLAAG